MQKRSASSHVDGQGAVEAADNLSEGWNDTDIADEAEHDTAFAHLGLRHLGNPSSCSAARSERVILRERGREEGKGVSLAGQVHKRDSFDPSRKAMMLRQITPGPSIRRADPHQIRTSTTDSGRSDEEDVFLENFESLQIGKAVERLLKENSHSSSQATGSGRSPHFPSTIPSLVAGEEWKALMQSVSQGDRRAERRQHASFSSKAAEQGGDCLEEPPAVRLARTLQNLRRNQERQDAMKRAAHLGAPLGLSIPRGAARSHLTETIQESEEEEEGDGTEGRGRKGTGGASSSSQQGACVFSHTWRRGSQQQQGQNSREGAGRAERGRGKGGSGGENAVKSYGFQDLFPSSPSSLLTVDDIGWAAADGAAASSSSSHIPPPRGSRERNSLRLKKEGSGPSLPQRPCGPLRPHSLPFNDGGGAGGSDGNEASVPAPPPSPPRPKAFTRLPPKKAGGSPMQKPSAGGNVKGSNPTLTGLSR